METTNVHVLTDNELGALRRLVPDVKCATKEGLKKLLENYQEAIEARKLWEAASR
jgi:hypothetical protein